MRVQTRHSYYRSVLQIVERITASRTGIEHVGRIAEAAGFSRFHLTRVFKEVLGEEMSEFIRRIRLERAAYQILHSRRGIGQIAKSSGYSGPEAFGRAFRKAFGMTATQLRETAASWTIPAPSLVHWNPNSERVALMSPEGEFSVSIQSILPQRFAVVRHVGPYMERLTTLDRFRRSCPGRVWKDSTSKFAAILHDPVGSAKCESFRADVGFALAPEEPPPPRSRLLEIPAGTFAVSPLVDAESFGSAWCSIVSAWIPSNGRRPANIPAIEIYEGYPLPWNAMRCRIHLGLDMDLGAID